MRSHGFLFWNVGGKDLSIPVKRIVSSNDIGTIVLAEPPKDEDILRRWLSLTGREFRFVKSVKRLAVYTVLEESDFSLSVIDTAGKYALFRARLFGVPVLLATAHLRSKMNGNVSTNQHDRSKHFADDIRLEESVVKHLRTIVVGDLNLHPTDSAMVSAAIFHAVPTLVEAKRITRVLDERLWPFFYSPMWGIYGDRTPGPPGTFYFDSPDYDTHYWSLLDQVLVRGAIADWLSDVQVLGDDGIDTLLNHLGRPDGDRYSDHLPLLFRLSFRNGG